MSNYIGTKIAKANISNVGPTDVKYIGGSTFELGSNVSQNGKAVRFSLAVFEQMVANEQIVITAGSKYQEIKNQIHPDGSTDTHNPDGSTKSNADRAFEQLKAEGYIQEEPKPESKERPEHPRMSSLQDKERPTRPTRPTRPSSGGDTGDSEEDTSSGRPTRPTRPAADIGRASSSALGSRDDDNEDEDDEEYEESAAIASPDEDVPLPQTPTQPAHLPGDLNGDGVVDDFDKLVAEEQSKNMLVMVWFFGSIILSFVMFFVGHAIVNTVAHGEEFKILPAGIEMPFAKKDNTSNQQQTAQNQESQQTQNTGDQPQTPASSNDNATQSDAAERTGFDPEQCVSKYPIADSNNQLIGTKMFSILRELISKGDVNGFCSAVDIQTIGSEVGIAYGNYAATEQNLLENEKEELKRAYSDGLVWLEKNHIVNKDCDASIFGGRVREVRQDPSNSSILFVVTESITGDHQRACFKMIQDTQGGGWTVTNMMDAAGYVKQIGLGN